jgi:hypothetical protein
MNLDSQKYTTVPAAIFSEMEKELNTLRGLQESREITIRLYINHREEYHSGPYRPEHNINIPSSATAYIKVGDAINMGIIDSKIKMLINLADELKEYDSNNLSAQAKRLREREEAIERGLKKLDDDRAAFKKLKDAQKVVPAWIVKLFQ